MFILLGMRITIYGVLLIKAIESEARIVSKLENILVQAWIYLSDKLRLTYLSWTNKLLAIPVQEDIFVRNNSLKLKYQ